jgi:peptidoglycan/xylan/chitin deacetylase (PgdA/CDA1 family)
LSSLFENLREPARVAVSFDLWNSEFEGIAANYGVSAIGGAQRGIPHANNRLLQFFAECDVVFLVQDDVRFLRPDWLPAYLNGLRTVPYLALFDPYYPEDVARPRHFKVNWFGRRRRVTREGQAFWLCRKAPQGAFQALSRACIEKIGGYDPEFGVFGVEHNDYWQRLCNAGLLPPECFYDVECGAELLKIDWQQPSSLTEREKTAAYQASERRRRSLYEETREGFRRTQLPLGASEVRVLRSGRSEPEQAIEPRQDAPDRTKWIYRKRIPVLAYHGIGGAEDDRFAVSAEQVMAHLDYLGEHFRFVPVSEAIDLWRQRGCFPPGLALLTFDDGYDDFLRIAERLAGRNVRGTVFACAGWVGSENSWDRAAFTPRRHMTWPEIAEIVAMGHEVGSHGIDHRRLTAMAAEDAAAEIAESRRILQDGSGAAVRAIAYPFGGADREVADAARQCYEAGFVAGQGRVLDWDEEPMLLRRISVGAGDDARTILTRMDAYLTAAPESQPVWYPHAPRRR